MNELTSSPKESISNKVIRGGGWVYGRMLFTNIMNLGVMAILARQLSPLDFGLIALAQVLTRFISIFASDGISQYVIYDNKPGREERVHAAFWMDLSLSILATLVGLLLIPGIAYFYDESGLESILLLIFCRFPIDSLSKIPDALFKKQLDFKKLEIRDTILEILIALLSIVMALTGWGVWSLVVPGVIASPLRAVMIFLISPWKPQFVFNFSHWSKIFSYSTNAIGSSALSHLVSEGDTLLIGKLMGSYSLGIYNLAWQSANLIGRTIVNLSNKLTFPALATTGGQIEQVRSGLEKIFRVLAVSTFPLLIWLFVVADDFIISIYGAQWQDAILPLRILIIFALRYAIGSVTGSVYKVIGRPDINFKLILIMSPFYLMGIWAGSFWGIVGVAVGVTVVRTVFGFIDFLIVGRCLHVSVVKVVCPVFPAFVAACMMGLGVYILKFPLNVFLSDFSFAKLIVFALSGGFIYLFLIRNYFSSLAIDILQVVRPFSPRASILISSMLQVPYK